jgi:hypothetical protein
MRESAKERNAEKKAERLAKEWPCACGETFHKAHGNQEYCSPDCPARSSKKASFKKWSDKVKSHQPEQTCEWPGCTNTFRDKRRTVCAEHSAAFKAEQNKIQCRNRRKPKTLKCKYCKSNFQYHKAGPAPMACPKPECQQAHREYRKAQALVRQHRYAEKQRG